MTESGHRSGDWKVYGEGGKVFKTVVSIIRHFSPDSEVELCSTEAKSLWTKAKQRAKASESGSLTEDHSSSEPQSRKRNAVSSETPAEEAAEEAATNAASVVSSVERSMQSEHQAAEKAEPEQLVRFVTEVVGASRPFMDACMQEKTLEDAMVVEDTLEDAMVVEKALDRIPSAVDHAAFAEATQQAEAEEQRRETAVAGQVAPGTAAYGRGEHSLAEQGHAEEVVGDPSAVGEPAFAEAAQQARVEQRRETAVADQVAPGTAACGCEEGSLTEPGRAEEVVGDPSAVGEPAFAEAAQARVEQRRESTAADGATLNTDVDVLMQSMPDVEMLGEYINLLSGQWITEYQSSTPGEILTLDEVSVRIQNDRQPTQIGAAQMRVVP